MIKYLVANCFNSYFLFRVSVEDIQEISRDEIIKNIQEELDSGTPFFPMHSGWEDDIYDEVRCETVQSVLNYHFGEWNWELFDSYKEAFKWINRSDYGLDFAVFHVYEGYHDNRIEHEFIDLSESMQWNSIVEYTHQYKNKFQIWWAKIRHFWRNLLNY